MTIFQRWKQTALHNKALVLTGVIVALGTLVSTGALVVQVCITAANNRKTSEQIGKLIAAADDMSEASDNFSDSSFWMEQHTDDAANAIQDSVDTADRNTKQTIHNAETTFRNEQRAWIGVSGAGDFAGFTETEPWRLTVVFFNSGRTPATNCRISLKFITTDSPIHAPPEEEIAKLVFKPTTSIAPQGNYREAIGGDFPAVVSGEGEASGLQTIVAHYGLIKARKEFLYYFGILKYNDAFGKSHETQYCISLLNPDTKQAGFCDGFNDLN